MGKRIFHPCGNYHDVSLSYLGQNIEQTVYARNANIIIPSGFGAEKLYYLSGLFGGRNIGAPR